MTAIKTILQPLNASSSPERQANENFDALSAAAIFGKDATTSAGLVHGYLGGIYNGAAVDPGTVTLGASATSYLVVNRGTGVVSASTATTNWNSTSYARLRKLTTSASAVTAEEDHRFDTNGLLLATAPATVQCIAIAVSDESTALTTGTAKVTYRMPFGFTLTEVRACCTTAPTGATKLQVDVKEAGVTIFSTPLTFDAGEDTTTTAAVPAVISDANLADDAKITIDVVAVGSTIAGAGLKVTLIGTKV